MNGKQALTTISHNNANIETLYTKVSYHIDIARQNVYRTVDTEMVAAYFKIGHEIVAEEQNGSERAEYGKQLLQALSQSLTTKYGKGFSISTLRDIRQFYLAYKNDLIQHALRGESKVKEEQIQSQSIIETKEIYVRFKLSWIHYRALMRVSRPQARQFYEIEAIKNKWSGRELERQIESLLFDRLAKSKDKEGMLKLASKGQEIESPVDAIRDPMILEFLNIPESNRLVESKLEDALISNLQHFLLELGKGFAFVARQKRLTFDGQHFYADLVFYHTILKCYIICDLKTKKLTHGDLGQMLLYVNYFDEEIKMDNDNPTIGLILCTEKSDKMVKYTLGEKSKQIFASQYQFHLPTVEELEKELKKEIREIKQQFSTEDIN